jgi:DNA-binding transcriptional MerR regulator
MFKIGDFSKISQVSIRSLRHYDALGLLKPSHTDPFTGYRYYAADQLPRLNRIVALKNLGLSLEEVKRLLDGNLSAAEIRGMLLLKQAQMRQQISDELRQLAMVESRVQQIEQEGALSPYDVVLKPVPALHVVSIREVSPTLDAMGTLISDAREAARQQARESELWLAVFYDPHFDVSMDWELGFVVPSEYSGCVRLDERRQMCAHTLPVLPQVASVIYQGSYIGLHHGYSALGTWIEQHGYSIAGNIREVFLSFDEANDQDHVTEIQFPVVHRAEAENPLT